MNQFHPDWNCQIEKCSHLIPIKKNKKQATLTCLHTHRQVALCGITVIPQFMGSIISSKTACMAENKKK
jgi:hypothetical protein